MAASLTSFPARDPFTLASGEKLPSSSLVNLGALRKSKHAVEVLKTIKKQADEVKVNSVGCRRATQELS
jgi:hypothetical protein